MVLGCAGLDWEALGELLVQGFAMFCHVELDWEGLGGTGRDWEALGVLGWHLLQCIAPGSIALHGTGMRWVGLGGTGRAPGAGLCSVLSC